MPFTLEKIVPHGQQLCTIQLYETVPHAIDLMHRHRFNQLPVVDSDGKTSRGQAVTFEGILHTLQSFKAPLEVLQVKDVAQKVRTYAPDADLLTTLDDIQEYNFALLVDNNNVLTGIVTTSDTTGFFRKYAQDLMRIEGIEERLKTKILDLFKGDDTGLAAIIAKVTNRNSEIIKKIRPAIHGYLEKMNLAIPHLGSESEALAEAEKRLALPKPGKSFDQLTMDEFIKVLLDHPKAPKLNKATGVKELRGMLERVRDARNKIAHFRGALTDEERRLIMVASDWIELNIIQDKNDDVPADIYAGISAHLAALSEEVDIIKMSFQEVEEVLGRKLPSEAYEDRGWWSNESSSPQQKAWVDKGWIFVGLGFRLGQIRFQRIQSGLSAHFASHGEEVEFIAMSFQELEEIMGRKLPQLAYKDRDWWYNDNFSSQKKAWGAEGYHACSVNLTIRRVHFRRHYDRLSTHLSTKAYNEFDALTMTFQEVEEVLGKKLPKEAYEDRGWWSNDSSSPQQKAWSSAGWRTTLVSITNKRVRFRLV